MTATAAVVVQVDVVVQQCLWGTASIGAARHLKP